MGWPGWPAVLQLQDGVLCGILQLVFAVDSFVHELGESISVGMAGKSSL